MSFVVNREVHLGPHTLINSAHVMGVLGKGNRDDPHESASRKITESHNRHEQDDATFLALLKTVGGNQEALACLGKHSRRLSQKHE